MTITGVERELCEELRWDSDFFGFPIARANFSTLDGATADSVDRWAADHGTRCLYFFAAADDEETVRTARDRGYHLADLRLTLARRFDGTEAGTTAGETRPASATDLPALEAIASTAHTDSRFYFDRNFPRPLCDELYRRWIRNSVAGYADASVVAGPHGQPEGYITCHLDRERGTGSIGLVAVHSAHRGRGIGSRLVRSALAWFAARGATRVSVVTQGRNPSAQSLYQRHGFVSHSIQLVYHRWYGVPA